MKIKNIESLFEHLESIRMIEMRLCDFENAGEWNYVFGSRAHDICFSRFPYLDRGRKIILIYDAGHPPCSSEIAQPTRLQHLVCPSEAYIVREANAPHEYESVHVVIEQSYRRACVCH